MARFRQTRTNRQTLKVELQGTPTVGYIEAKLVRRRVASYIVSVEGGPKRTFTVDPPKGARASLKEAKLWLKAEIVKHENILELAQEIRDVLQGLLLTERVALYQNSPDDWYKIESKYAVALRLRLRALGLSSNHNTPFPYIAGTISMDGYLHAERTESSLRRLENWISKNS